MASDHVTDSVDRPLVLVTALSRVHVARGRGQTCALTTFDLSQRFLEPVTLTSAVKFRM